MKNLASVALASLLLLAACGQKPAETREAPIDGAAAPQSASGGSAPFAAPGGTGVAASQPLPLPPGALMLQRAAIPDPGVIRRGTAMNALIPAGWSTRGGVVALTFPCAEPYGVDWAAVSPDGLAKVSLFPTETWQWSNSGLNSECRQAGYANVRDYLAARAGATHPGARMLDYRLREDFARSAADHAARLEQLGRQYGFNWRVRAEGGEILFAYQENGVEMRGTMGATAVFHETALENPMGGEALRTLTGSTLGVFAAAAPNGQLDFEVTEAVRRSIAPDPQWLDALFSLKAAIGQTNVEATRERAAIIVAGGAEATRRNIAAFQAMAGASVQNSRDSIAAQQGSGEIYPGSNAQDRMQRESVEAIRGVETYHDPVGGGQVQLDATYDHAWRVNSSETYILTKDPNFNPGAYGVEATQLPVVQ